MIERFDPLETRRLSLEPITDHIAQLIAAGDVGGLDPADGWPQQGTRNGVSLAMEHGHPPGWLIRRNGRVIGDCGIRGPVDDAGCVEIGYGLGGPYRGQGFGTELVVAISDWLLGRPDVTTVRATTAVTNVASRRVLEKAGFTLVQTTEEETIYERFPLSGQGRPGVPGDRT